MCPVCCCNLKTKATNTTGSNHLYNTLELLMMGIVVPETCWASNKICSKNHLLHPAGILFPHIRLTICLQYRSRSSKWPLSFRLSNQSTVYIFPLPYVPRAPPISLSLYLLRGINQQNPHFELHPRLPHAISTVQQRSFHFPKSISNQIMLLLLIFSMLTSHMISTCHNLLLL